MVRRDTPALQQLEADLLAEAKAWQTQEGISDSLMQRMLFPPEWRRRERPPRFWDHVISMPDAFEACGKAQFGDLWKGNIELPVEWHARHDVYIRSWGESEAERYNSVRCAWQGWQSCDTSLSKAVDFYEDAEIEKAAYGRKIAIYKILKAWLNTEKITAFTIAESGERFPMLAHEWLRPEAFSVLEWGRKSGKEKEHEIGPQSWDYEALYLDNEQFSRQLEHLADGQTADSQARPISEADLKKFYNEHVEHCQNSGNVHPSWREDKIAIEKASGKKVTDKQIKQIRAACAPREWSIRGRKKKG